MSHKPSESPFSKSVKALWGRVRHLFSFKSKEGVKEEPKPQWKETGLDPEILALVEKAGFKHPSPVQAAAIPAALQGRDLIACAQTGTGKTAAFVLPMVQKLRGLEGTYGLVLAPSREIALQITKTLDLFAPALGLRSIALIGGVSMTLDTQAIQTYPHIIVATPGRLCDHLDRGNIWLEFLKFVVLDEADRMLDMGFADQLHRILRETSAESRQTLLFSATMPKSVEQLAAKILKEPESVQIGKRVSPAKTVQQSFVLTSEEGKMDKLFDILEATNERTIVFVKSKLGVNRVWGKLWRAGHKDVTYIHSGLKQEERERSLERFSSGRYRVMIATDVLGRGIHVDGVDHVVNFDLPRDPEDYVHRIGRTGRADSTGRATTFITSRERAAVKHLEETLGLTPAREDQQRRHKGTRSSAPSGSGASGGGGPQKKRRRPRHKPQAGTSKAKTKAKDSH